MKRTLLRRFSLLLGLLAILGLLAVACGEEEEEGPTPAATTPAATTPAAGTPAASPTPAAEIGGAGIASNPRQVQGLEGIFTLDDGLAAWKERPADEIRTGVTADTIVLGRFAGVTGAVATYEAGMGHPTMQAIIDRVNEAGGIHGRELKLITRDDQFNPTLTVQIAKELVEKDKVFAIVNPLSEQGHDTVAEYLNENKVLDLYGYASYFVYYPARPWFFANRGPTEQDGANMAESVLSLTPNATVVTMTFDNAYGQGFLDGAKYYIEKGGGQVLAEITASPAQADWTPQAVQAASLNPDWVMFSGGHAQAVSVVRALKLVAGYEGKIFQAGGIALDEATSELLDGTYGGRSPDQDAISTPNDPAILAYQKLLSEEGVNYIPQATELGIRIMEMLVRSLEIAGPDLTREGLVEAMYLAFDGSWKCSLCGFPRIFTPEDHFTDSATAPARWSHADQEWEILGPVRISETSQDTGVIGNLPKEGFECLPPSADHPQGTCPWKSQ